MPDRRRGVLWLTLGLTISLLLATGIGYFATGGAPAAYERQARAGLWAPRVLFTPNFANPAPALAPAADTQPVTADGVARALAPLADDPRFAGKLGLSVVDVATGESLYGVRSDAQVTPASTTKIVTAMAALAGLGPYHRFATRVVAGSEPGEIVLIGGGDPTLAVGAKGSYPGASRLDALANQVRAAGPVSRIVVDSSLFTGADRAPGWDPAIVNEGFVAPVNALTINGGRLTPSEANSKAAPRSPAPDLFAGQALAKLLDVPSSAVTRGTAAEGAKELGRLDSPPLLQLVEQMLQVSDNVIAESLLRQVALSKGKPATFEGGQEAVRQILTELGLDPAGHALVDGSGLSRHNKISPALLTAILHATTADQNGKLRGVLAGLPVAAYSGTLAKRFAATPAGAGEVRAKTGTLLGVSALAGVVMTNSGRQLAFAAITDGLAPGGNDSAEVALDRIGAALARCGCQ